MKGEQLALFPLPRVHEAMTTERRNALTARERYRRAESSRRGFCAIPSCRNTSVGLAPFPGLCGSHRAAALAHKKGRA